MKTVGKCLLLLTTLAAIVGIGLPDAAAAPFTAGNLVVERIGDGSIALSSGAHPLFLDEYTAGGSLAQSLAMPTAVSGSNKRLVDSGTQTLDGYLTRSVDERHLIVPGYDAAVGTPTVVQTTAASVNRVIGRVDWLGNIDTTTALSDTSYAGSAGNNGVIRSVASTDGTAFWASGNAQTAANGGARYVGSLGGSTSFQMSSAPQNTRLISIQGGQLFISAQSGAFRGVSSVGTGIPTTSGQTTTLLPGFDPSTSSPESAVGFVFGDVSPSIGFLSTGFDVLWVADDRTAAGGGIQRWIYDGTTWSLNASLLLGTANNLGARGLIGSYDGASGTMTLFATTTEASANQIIRLTDSFDGVSWSFGAQTSVATAAANTVFRGIAFTPVPEPQSLFLFGTLGFLGWMVFRRRQGEL